jgi:hypothetical protein
VFGLGHSEWLVSQQAGWRLDSERISYDPQEFFGVAAGIGYRWMPGVSRSVGSGWLRSITATTAMCGQITRRLQNYQANVRIWDVRFSMLARCAPVRVGQLYAAPGSEQPGLRRSRTIDPR